MSDILEDLDRWLSDDYRFANWQRDALKRARNEIAALRGAAKLDRALIRDEALIEAAAAAGAAIRGLKR